MRRLPALIAVLVAGLATAAVAAPATNPAEALRHLPIERFEYDPATHCVKKPAAGTVALQRWLERNARGASWGINRCEKWGPRSASLHAEGRALDWHLDAGNPRDAREAKRLIELLFAADSKGHPAALARRMGVQGLIWDCKAWFGGPPQLRRYSACRKGVDKTTAHRDHIHFELSKAGARKLTSFWTRKAPPTTLREDTGDWGEDDHEDVEPPYDVLPGEMPDEDLEDPEG